MEIQRPGDGWRRVSPPYPRPMWVRLGGLWRPGWVLVWWQDAEGNWYAWGKHGGERGVAAAWALWVYDPGTIKPRDGDEPPPG